MLVIANRVVFVVSVRFLIFEPVLLCKTLGSTPNYQSTRKTALMGWFSYGANDGNWSHPATPKLTRLQAQLASEGFLAKCHRHFSPTTLAVASKPITTPEIKKTHSGHLYFWGE